MWLPHEVDKLHNLRLDKMGLGRAILDRRSVFRYSRDQKGGDRCWIDDIPIHRMLSDTKGVDIRLMSLEERMDICNCFYCLRRADEPDTTPADAILDPRKWDLDLISMVKDELFQTLYELQQEIFAHRLIPVRLRTLYDDRRLYRCLPEKLVADFRLGSKEQFIGEKNTSHPCCVVFWRSHENCTRPCVFTRYGPCLKVD